MKIVENTWIFFQGASLVLSLLCLVRGSTQWIYSGAYFAIVISLGISIYQASLLQQKQKGKDKPIETDASKSTKIPQREPLTDLNSWIQEGTRLYLIAKPHLKPLLSNQSTPYLILAIFQWLFLKKLVITLVPFAIFAFFHVLSHIRNYVIPSLSFISTLTKEKVKKILEKANNNLSPTALLVAAHIEILCFFVYLGNTFSWFLLKLIGRGSGFIVNLLAVIVWFVFLNVRYDESFVVKKVVHNLVSIVDGITADPRVPYQISQYWNQIKVTNSFIFQRIKVGIK